MKVAAEVWLATAHAAGLHEQTRVHGVGDGAPWILTQFEEHFGQQGDYLIDFFHVSEYVGADRVNGAIRRLIAAHDSADAPLATTLDLYSELQAVTPDSLRYLLHDLFEVNTYWKLDTERATAKQTSAGTWEVTLDVRAVKIVADSAGSESILPMDEWVEIGVFAEAERGGELSAPLYVGRRRIHSGEQSIRVTVSRKPALAGIDPYHLLDWEEREDDDNIDGVTIVEAGGRK